MVYTLETLCQGETPEWNDQAEVSSFSVDEMGKASHRLRVGKVGCSVTPPGYGERVLPIARARPRSAGRAGRVPASAQSGRLESAYWLRPNGRAGTAGAR